MATMTSGLGGAAGYGENSFKTNGVNIGDLDDGAVSVDVSSIFSSGMDVAGSNYTDLYINTNGSITFGGAEPSYTETIFTADNPMIAAFLTDVDLSNGGDIHWDLDTENGTVTITWDGVAPYSGSGNNSFQIVLTDLGNGDFNVEFIYEDIQYTNGSSGNATVGFADGSGGATALAGSGNSATLSNYETYDFGTGGSSGTYQGNFTDGAQSDGPQSGPEIFGVDGDDSTIDGSDSSDIIYGGADNDGISTGDDTVNAEYGDDIVYGGDGDDSLDGGLGNDTIDGGDGADTISGGFGNDSIDAGAGDDVIFGAASDGAGASESMSGFTFNSGSVSSTGAGSGPGDTGEFAVYDSVGTTDDGTVVQARITVVSLSNSSLDVTLTNGMVTLNSAGVAPAGASAEIRIEFFNQSTGQPIKLDSSFTFRDIDSSSESVTIGKDDAQTVAVSANPATNLAVTDNGDTFTIDVPGGESSGGVDEDHWATVSFIEQSSMEFTLTSRSGGTNYEFNTTDFTNTPTIITVPAADDDTIDAGAGNDLVYGGGGDNSVEGDTGNDTIYGGDGSDQIDAGTGNDQVFGGANADTVFGGAGDDYIRYGTGADLVYAGDGDDVTDDASSFTGEAGTVYGGAGNDLVRGSGGDDTLYGGTGNDSFEADGGDDTVFGDDGEDIILSFDGADLVFGGAGADSINGGSNGDTVDGGLGDDTIDGGTGTDTLDGGAGNDTLIGGDSIDTLTGGAGNDIVYGGAGEDIFSGTTGDNTFYGGDGADTITADLTDTIYGGAGDDRLSGGGIMTGGIYGGTGNDDLIGSNQNQRLFGGAGNDSLNGGYDLNTADVDTLDGGDGDDVLVSGMTATPTNTTWEKNGDILIGGAGNDTITGGMADDQIYGGTGNDSINGGNGNDVIYVEDNFGSDLIYGGETALGGSDRDTLDLSALGPGVTVTYTGNEQGTFTDGTHTSTFYGIEDVILTGVDDDFDASSNALSVTIDAEAGNDSVIGSGGDDSLSGSTGDDTIAGGAGSDIIYGGDGADSLTTGTGEDAIYGGAGDDNLANSAGNDTLVGGTGNDTLTASAGNDLLYGGTGNDILHGGQDDDTLYGGAGNDSLEGRTGDNTIYAGDGADAIEIGYGDDTIFGGEGGIDFDRIDGSAADDALTITITGTESGTFSDEDGDDGTFEGIESFVLTSGADIVDGSAATSSFTVEAGAGDDVLTGGSGNDSFEGGAGNNTFFGGAGDDTLIGGDNDDSLSGGLGNDIIYGGGGVDEVNSGLGNDLVYAGTGDETVFASDGADTVYAGVGNDRVIGGDGDDTLFGGAGNDTLGGGAGNDTLIGGAGDDTFALSALGGNYTINDFGTGNDQIDASALNDGSGGAVTADEVIVTGGGGSDQVLSFPNGETVTVPDGTIDTTTTATQFASLVSIGVPPCFAPGTMIATPSGDVPVELLRPGDAILTADNGAQTLRWIGRRDVVFDANNPRGDKDKPVEIKAGALGRGPNGALPRRDLIVSPQHKLVLSGPAIAKAFGTPEVFAIAKALTGLPNVRRMAGKRQVTYYALLFDGHQVIFAEGAPTESFRPGPVALADFMPEHRAQIFELYPGLETNPEVALGPTARPIVKRRKVENLILRCDRDVLPSSCRSQETEEVHILVENSN